MYLLKLISGTFLSRIVQAGVNFLLALLLARWLGAEGKGFASLLLLNISLIVLIQNVAGGGALIYLIPKFGWRPLKKTVYIWAFLASILTAFIIHLVSDTVVPLLELMAVGVLVNLSTVQQHLLLACNKIKQANWQLIILSIGLMLLVLGIYFGPIDLSIYNYALCIGIAYAVSLTFGAFQAKKFIGTFNRALNLQEKPIKELFTKGAFSQTANTFQLFNYRLSYYFIEQFLSISSLGVYSIVMNLADLAWLPSRALATILHSRVANATSRAEQNKDLTQFSWYSLGFTLLAIIIMVAIPDRLYVYVFGNEFRGIQVLAWWISPGVLALGVSNALAHYFNGIGLHHLNTIASGIGLLSTIIGLMVLIPSYGLVGAALTATVAYTLSALFLTFVWIAKKSTLTG